MLGYGGNKGERLITETLAQFETVQNDLREGIRHCEAEMGVNNAQVAQLQIRNGELGRHRDRALHVIGRIGEIIQPK